jgi:hypothetical protein
MLNYHLLIAILLLQLAKGQNDCRKLTIVHPTTLNSSEKLAYGDGFGFGDFYFTNSAQYIVNDTDSILLEPAEKLKKTSRRWPVASLIQVSVSKGSAISLRCIIDVSRHSVVTSRYRIDTTLNFAASVVLPDYIVLQYELQGKYAGKPREPILVLRTEKDVNNILRRQLKREWSELIVKSNPCACTKN